MELIDGLLRLIYPEIGCIACHNEGPGRFC